MSEMRCPMCGKPNPAESEVCQHCQARLKPLKIEPSPEDQARAPQEGAGSAGESPDWFQSLRDASAEEVQPEAEGEDWINDLREQPSRDEGGDTGELDWASGVGRDTGLEAETSDWLSRIRSESPVAEPGEPPFHGRQDFGEQASPDWLSRDEEAEASDRPTGVEPGAPGSSAEGGDSLAEPGGLPDWLTSAGEQAETPPGSDEGLLDRLAGTEIEEAAPAPKERRTGLTGMLSWLERPGLEDVPASETPQTTGEEGAPELHREEEPEGEGLLDWLTDEEAQEIEPASLPDWLIEEEPPEAEPVSLPDWLAEEALVAGGEEASREEAPDWLEEAEAVEPEGERPLIPRDEETSQAADLEAPGGELPDWLVDSEEEELPDWLAGERAAADTVAPAAEEPGDEAIPDWMLSSEEELPDWLADEEIELGEAGEFEVPGHPTLEQLETGAIPEPTEEPVEDQVHDMMASLSRQTAMVDPGFSEDEGDELEEDLDWLADLESTYPDLDLEELQAAPTSGDAVTPFAAGAQDGEEPAFGEDLPEWLSAVAAGEEDLEDELSEMGAEPAEFEAEGDLTPAELPSWLEAMRPVAAAAAAVQILEEDAEPEGAGPLAGLKGVLRAEPGISYARKPPTYSVKLRATETQQANAELLRQLIEAEGVARPIPAAPVVTSQYLLRVAIFIVLVLSILGALIIGVPQLEIPMIPSVSTDALVVSQLVSSIPAGSPVLVAVDYEPGLSGEMDVYAGVVLEHLFTQGAFISLVSTSPTGPVQAERLVAKVAGSGNEPYRSPDQYINLGFVPGGPAGLLSFATTPQQVLPRTMDGKLAWKETALAGIQDLSGFAMVVVATENPDTARAWVEQVQPRIGAAPLVLVASAQAEPILRPYYEGIPQQAQGLLSGPAASAAYLNLTPSVSQNDARIYWGPFSIGALIVSILILVGGGMNAIMAMFKPRKEAGEGEA